MSQLTDFCAPGWRTITPFPELNASGGQVIGSTDRTAAEPKDRPVKFHEVFATLYHNMGILEGQERIFDASGTPRGPVDAEIKPLKELI